MLCNFATAETSLGLQDQGVATAHRAVALEPVSAAAHRTLLNALPYRDGVTGAEMLAAAQNFSARLEHPAAPDFANDRTPDRPLRIALLSGSMRTHPVGWLTIAGFENLDPARHNLVGLAQREGTDPIARRFRAVTSEWHDVSPLDDAALAALCRDRRIDILIDLGGFGDGGRATACTHRAAPVQIKWVGMQTHSSGLPEMDWMITDRWQTPPGAEALYSERPLRMPDGYVCYSPPPYAPDPAPLPARRNGFVTFGCFNNLAKITPATLQDMDRHPAPRRGCAPGAQDPSVLRTRTLRAHPGGVQRPPASRPIASSCAAPPAIASSSASTTTSTSCSTRSPTRAASPRARRCGWACRPSRLPGTTFSSRHSVSHLSNAGLSDWVANSREDYVRLACARAAELDALESLRATLRARVKASPLCDAPRFGAHLAAALRSVWHDWCQRN